MLVRTRDGVERDVTALGAAVRAGGLVARVLRVVRQRYLGGELWIAPRDSFQNIVFFIAYFLHLNHLYIRHMTL